jgi:hypothetical protein
MVSIIRIIEGRVTPLRISQVCISCIMFSIFAIGAIAQDSLAGPAAYSVRPPASVAGRWMVCRTLAVSSNDTSYYSYNDNPIGQTITFAKGAIRFHNRSIAVTNYMISQVVSVEAFEFEYGIKAKQLGIATPTIIITPNFVSGARQDFVGATLVPVSRHKLAIAWNGWWLLALPSTMSCHK